MSDDDKRASQSPGPPEGGFESSAPWSLPARPRGFTRRGWLLAVTAVVTIAVLYAAQEILLPFILALVIAYVFTPAVLWLEKRRIPRWVAILGIYAVTLGSAYLFIHLTAPRLVAEVRSLAQEAPKNVKKIEEEIIPAWERKLQSLAGTKTPAPVASASASSTAPEDPHPPAVKITKNDDGSYDVDVGSGVVVHPTDDGGYRVEPVEATPAKRGPVARIVDWVRKNYVEVVRSSIGVVLAVARSIFLFFMTLMLAAYLMLTHEQVIGFFRGLVRPSARRDFDRLLTRIDEGLSGVVRGQLLICLVNGVLTAIGFALIGLKYWPVLALVAAVGSLIPIFGSIITSVPAIAIGLTQSPMTAVLALAWIIGIHQVEANYLNPKIIGTAAHLHPVLVVFVLLAGEHWFHAAGALLAVPCLSIARSLFLHFREIAEREPIEPRG